MKWKSRRAYYVLAVTVCINFLNYMDRWVASAVAPLVQAEFDLNDDTARDPAGSS